MHVSLNLPKILFNVYVCVFLNRFAYFIQTFLKYGLPSYSKDKFLDVDKILYQQVNVNTLNHLESIQIQKLINFKYFRIFKSFQHLITQSLKFFSAFLVIVYIIWIISNFVWPLIFLLHLKSLLIQYSFRVFFVVMQLDHVYLSLKVNLIQFDVGKDWNTPIYSLNFLAYTRQKYYLYFNRFTLIDQQKLHHFLQNLNLIEVNLNIWPKIIK